MSKLLDLEGLIKACRKRYDDLPKNIELNIPAEFWNKFKPVYESSTSDKIIFNGTYSFVIQNSTASEVAEISTRWMLYAYAFSPFYKALSEYQKAFSNILNDVAHI
jgi:hypothetical protein